MTERIDHEQVDRDHRVIGRVLVLGLVVFAVVAAVLFAVGIRAVGRAM